MRVLLIAACVLTASSACKDEPGVKPSAASSSAKASETAASGTSTPPVSGDACADYIAAMEACKGKLPSDQQGPWQEQIDKQRKAVADASGAAKKQLEPGCRTGLATVKTNPACK